jgi:hypothetical protein
MGMMRMLATSAATIPVIPNISFFLIADPGGPARAEERPCTTARPTINWYS